MKTFMLYACCILTSYSLFASGYLDGLKTDQVIDKRIETQRLLNERKLLEFKLRQLPSTDDLTGRLNQIDNRLIELKGEAFLYDLEALRGGGDPY